MKNLFKKLQSPVKNIMLTQIEELAQPNWHDVKVLLSLQKPYMSKV